MRRRNVARLTATLNPQSVRVVDRILPWRGRDVGTLLLLGLPPRGALRQKVKAEVLAAICHGDMNGNISNSSSRNGKTCNGILSDSEVAGMCVRLTPGRRYISRPLRDRTTSDQKRKERRLQEEVDPYQKLASIGALR